MWHRRRDLSSSRRCAPITAIGKLPCPALFAARVFCHNQGESSHEEQKINMARPVTLFTGQWADLPLAELAPRAKEMGFDGLELACWGDHLDVQKAATDKSYCEAQKKILTDNGLQLFAISNHLAGQAVCDKIDERHQSILPPHVWGDGDPVGVNQRAAEEMKTTARAAANLGLKVVNGFTGSSIWPYLYSFPPVPPAWIDKGF